MSDRPMAILVKTPQSTASDCCLLRTYDGQGRMLCVTLDLQQTNDLFFRAAEAVAAVTLRMAESADHG